MNERSNGDGATAAGSPPVAFEVIHALPGFCRLSKRSPTLDGSLPLRAAQHCTPVFEGNEAGYQISLEQPMTLSRGTAGIEIDMTPPAFAATQEHVRACVERLVKDGLLEKGGHWHRLLREDALPVRGSRIHLWSGFLVRPMPGVCLRVGPAFNRRSRISVLEHAVADRSGFTPLMLEIDGRALGPEPRTISDEIGCVLPVASHAGMTMAPLRDGAGIAQGFESFFDAHYFATKNTKPTGKYRRILRDQPEAAASPTSHAKVYYGGPAIHSVESLSRFHGPSGLTKEAPPGVALPSCTVRSVGRVVAHWDGQIFTREKTHFARAVPTLERDWREAGGDPSSDGFEFLKGSFYGPARDEPYWLLQPWVFGVTDPGWSTVVDGLEVGGCDGMRGIIHTDRFHSITTVYRMYAPGTVVVPKGAAVMRFYPIPRSLQNARMGVIDRAAR